MEIKEILSKVDHTLLKPESTWEQIKEICDDGIKYETASVCIPPSFVKQAADYVDGKIAICTVIGFPNGYNTTEIKCAEAAQAVEKAGAFMLVLEGIPEKLAAIITKKVHIPTIGIGASAECDGQVLVYQDMLAMYGNFVPKFVKQFAQVGEVMQGAVKDYINAVKEGTFPGPENTYAISDDVIEKLY